MAKVTKKGEVSIQRRFTLVMLLMFGAVVLVLAVFLGVLYWPTVSADFPMMLLGILAAMYCVGLLTACSCRILQTFIHKVKAKEQD